MGGYVYRGTEMPEVAGRYLYADLCAGELRSIQLGLPLAGGDRAETVPNALNGPWSFGEDASCRLYVTDGDDVDLITGSATGTAAPACAPSSATPVKKRKCKKRRHHKKHRAADSKKHKKKRCKKKH